MAYAEALTALGHPTRRAIFERLRSGPRAAGELAHGLPVTRPAVSQHLRVLLEAGLVRVQERGTSRVYSVDRDGLAEVRSFFDRFWDDALEGFRRELEEER